MFHYVYKITDPVTNEFYIGSRACNCEIIDDTYMGSPHTWKPTDKSRLQKTILKDDFTDKQSAVQYESNLIETLIDDDLNRNYYIPERGFHFLGAKHNPETIEKMKKSHSKYWTGKHLSDAHKIKLSKSNTGRKSLSDEQYRKIGESQRGKIISIETRYKISKSHIGRKLSEETKKKISIANIGRQIDTETKLKISKSKFGKKRKPFTDIAKNNMSKTHIGKLNHNWLGYIIVSNVNNNTQTIYETSKLAANALKVAPCTIIKYCKNGKILNNYKLLISK